MKNRTTIIHWAAIISLASVLTSPAQEHPSTVVKVADVAFVRPVCFASTAISGAFFLFSLPVTAATGHVHQFAQALVVRPAKATFSRPLGDLDALADRE
ncbi:MAG TPA: hypothetical protein VG146_23355 [Verrucomicrobiae bacterium]|nr:hypothetical protein [Verrucomicrobiae bacterium]